MWLNQSSCGPTLSLNPEMTTYSDPQVLTAKLAHEASAR